MKQCMLKDVPEAIYSIFQKTEKIVCRSKKYKHIDNGWFCGIHKLGSEFRLQIYLDDSHTTGGEYRFNNIDDIELIVFK